MSGQIRGHDLDRYYRSDLTSAEAGIDGGDTCRWQAARQSSSGCQGRTSYSLTRSPRMPASNEHDSPKLSIVRESPADLDRLSGPTDLIDELALANRLGVSRSTLQSWRYSGRGPRFIKLGRMVRYRVADVDAYLNANTHGEVA